MMCIQKSYKTPLFHLILAMKFDRTFPIKCIKKESQNQTKSIKKESKHLIRWIKPIEIANFLAQFLGSPLFGCPFDYLKEVGL